jgi:Protein of unknown function (DUF2510)
MTGLLPAPGWYPDPSDPRKRIYWDGTAWSGPAEADTSNNGKKRAVAVGVCVLVVLGLVMSMQSVSLITGSGPVWTGVAVVAAGTGLPPHTPPRAHASRCFQHHSPQEGRSKVMPWTTSSGTFTVMRSTLGPMVLPSMSLRSVRCPPPPSAR